MSQYEYWLGRATAVYITVLLQRQQVCSSEKLAILGQCKHFGQAGAIPLVELALYKQFVMYTVTRFMPKKRNTQYLRCLRPNSQNVPLANLSHHCWRMRRCKTTFFLRLLIVNSLVLRQAAANAGRYHSISNRCTTAHRDKIGFFTTHGQPRTNVRNRRDSSELEAKQGCGRAGMSINGMT